MATVTLERVLEDARRLPAAEQQQLVAMLEAELAGREPSSPGETRSSYGALKHLGRAPSAEDIDDVRREMWAGFAEDEAA
jgi:hypothetical protein